MALQVLQSTTDITAARATLESRGLSCLTLDVPRRRFDWRRLLRPTRRVQLGDTRKSWDVLLTADFIAANYPADARVLDLGAYNSEILPVLHRMGFSRLTGVDLDPRTVGMPFGDTISWQVGDFLRTPFPDNSFDVVTAISVIEHGFDADRLLGEVSRLLVPGGRFIASFDYWPEKINTDGVLLFDMTWRIFSRDDVKVMMQRAADYGLESDGVSQFEASERTIDFSGQQYTFAWFTLRKRMN